MPKKSRLLISDKARAKRDAAILRLRAEGKIASEIANELKIKAFTVYNVLFAARKRGETVAGTGRGRRATKVGRPRRIGSAPAIPRVHLSEIEQLQVENRILRTILASVPQVKELLAGIAA